MKAGEKVGGKVSTSKRKTKEKISLGESCEILLKLSEKQFRSLIDKRNDERLKEIIEKNPYGIASAIENSDIDFWGPSTEAAVGEFKKAKETFKRAILLLK